MDHIKDIIKESYNGESPITYGATLNGPNHEKIPEETALTHKLDWGVE